VIFKRRCIVAKDIFKPGKPKDLEKRKTIQARAWIKGFKVFLGQRDAIEQTDGSYVVGGDVKDWGPLNYGSNNLSVQYRVVGGNFSCNSGSLIGAPQVIGGNFHFDGLLKSTDGFPKVVGGDVVIINHPIRDNNRNVKIWTEDEIRKVCKAIGGRLTIENH
jgi:hypothetical protein